MGSATRSALSVTLAALGSGASASPALADELLSAGRVIGGSAQLRSMLTDPGISAEAKRSAVERLFGPRYSAQTVSLLSAAASSRWSSADDFLAGIEELGIRAAAGSAPAGVSLTDELFAFETAVRSNAELELAMSSTLGDSQPKVTLVRRLLADASPQTRAIVEHLVQQPRGRRIRELLRSAAQLVADQNGLAIATVRTAAPLSTDQLTRLANALSGKYGENLSLNQVIDPDLIGGLRIAVGDTIIDGSVATRLADLRLSLVGSR